MEKPITRINLLAKRIGLDKSDIAMCIIYIMTHDKVLAWSQTKGHKSKSKNLGSMAQQAFNKPKPKQFIEMLGGMLSINAALYFSQSGLPNESTKELNDILKTVLIDPKTDLYRLDKINHVLSFALANGLNLVDKEGKRVGKSFIIEDEELETDTMAVNSDEMTDAEKELLRIEEEKNFIKLTPEMSRDDFLLYLIQEQGRSANQKAKNDFTLKISEYMAFKNDKTNELRPTIYLCNREHTSTLERLSSLAKGSFNK